MFRIAKRKNDMIQFLQKKKLIKIKKKKLKKNSTKI